MLPARFKCRNTQLESPALMALTLHPICLAAASSDIWPSARSAFGVHLWRWDLMSSLQRRTRTTDSLQPNCRAISLSGAEPSNWSSAADHCRCLTAVTVLRSSSAICSSGRLPNSWSSTGRHGRYWLSAEDHHSLALGLDDVKPATLGGLPFLCRTAVINSDEFMMAMQAKCRQAPSNLFSSSLNCPAVPSRRLEARWLVLQIFVYPVIKAASLSRALFLNARAWRRRKSQGGAQRAQGEQYLEFFAAAI